MSERALFDEIARIAYELWEKNGCSTEVTLSTGARLKKLSFPVLNPFL